MYPFLIIILFFSASLWGEEQPAYIDPAESIMAETAMLEQLILTTQKQLEQQRKLKRNVEQYIDLQKKYEQNTKDAKLAARLVKKAHLVFKQIKNLELTQSFDPKFISELSFFSSIAEKQAKKPA